MPPGWAGAGRPEKRVTAKSNPPQKKCVGLALPRKPVLKRFSALSALASAMELEQPALSGQLAILRRAGLVTARRDGPNVMYALADDRIASRVDRTRIRRGARAGSGENAA